MKLAASFVDAWTPRARSVLRIVGAFLFMFHGMQKLFGFPIALRATVQPLSLMGTAGMLELFGGALLLLGVFTRPVAFLLSGEMAFAYFIAHAPHGLWPFVNHGELAALYSFLFLFVAVTGAGPWSVDHWLQIRARATVDPARRPSLGARRA